VEIWLGGRTKPEGCCCCCVWPLLWTVVTNYSSGTPETLRHAMRPPLGTNEFPLRYHYPC
jgi:hypothetical protein